MNDLDLVAPFERAAFIFFFQAVEDWEMKERGDGLFWFSLGERWFIFCWLQSFELNIFGTIDQQAMDRLEKRIFRSICARTDGKITEKLWMCRFRNKK